MYFFLAILATLSKKNGMVENGIKVNRPLENL